jgi:hypothetical protein
MFSFDFQEEQPEQKSHFLPGAMRNPSGVSHNLVPGGRKKKRK